MDIESQPLFVTWSATSVGHRVIPLRVELTFGRGFAGVTIIGNAGQICDDGVERSRSALERFGWNMPFRRILVSVSPGDAKIDSGHFDLALCAGLIFMGGDYEWAIDPSEWMFAGEISLNGEIRPVQSVVVWATAALEANLKGIVVAVGNLPELRSLMTVIENLRTTRRESRQDFCVVACADLDAVMKWLMSGTVPEVPCASIVTPTESVSVNSPDFDDMELSADLQLVAVTAAAGMHSLLLRGSPGTGKSMFARRLTSIVPKMNFEDHLAALKIHSSKEATVNPQIVLGLPPYRAPHHFISLAAMLGTATAPGELSLATGGVLFLDELPEFRRDVLEGLREPIETGEVSVSRVGSSAVWTAKVLLVAAANNCPCGWNGSKRRRCLCATSKLMAYRQRLSGPLQDRIDMHINMEEPSNTSDQWSAMLEARSVVRRQTNDLRQKVLAARERVAERVKQATAKKIVFNRDLSMQQLVEAFGCSVSAAVAMIEKIIPKHASTRSSLRCLRVARTIADVQEKGVVTAEDLERAWSWQAVSAARMRGEQVAL